MKKIMSLMILLFTLFSLACENNIDVGKSTSKLTSSATTDAGYVGTTVSWTDSGGKTRTAFMVDPTTTTDPSGSYGGYLRKYTYVLPTNVTRTVTAGATQPGFGFAATQRGSDYVLFSTKYTPGGVKTVVSSGAEHTIIEYSYSQLKSSGGAVINVPVKVQWMFISGKDHPVYTVTHDTSSYALAGYSGDAKSPYGDLEYADVATSTIDGVGWGDKYKFLTTSAPATMSSTWTYNVANTLPYVYSWNNTKNAEIGLLATSPYTKQDAGQGMLYTNWTKTSATKVVDSGMPATPNMPYDWNWTYSLHQWQLPTTTSKPIGWQMQYGAVGTNSASKYATGGVGTITGYPYQSYSLYVLLGQKTVTSTAVTRQEALVALATTATRGSLVTTSVAGIGRSDTVSLSNGYNPIYGTIDVTPDTYNAMVVSMAAGTKTVVNPMFRIKPYTTAVPTDLKYDDITLTTTDYVTSLDSASQTLFVVLKKSFTGTHTFSVNDSIVAPPTPFAAIAYSNVSLSGYNSDLFTWKDSANKERSCYLVRNDALDPSGFYGGYIVKCSYLLASTVVDAAARTEAPGWGYTVHHLSGGADRDTMSSRRAAGTFRTIFAGKHHSIYEYSWDVLRSQGELPTYPQVDRPVKTKIHYVFSTGRDSIVWAHTIDSSLLAANAFNADDRSPYGALKYDGVEGPISGLGWGDHYKFRTTSSPVSLSSGTWIYNVATLMPHTVMWTNSNNSEMSLVQTEKYTAKDAGQGWFYTNWGKTSSTRIVDSGIGASGLPYDWNWTYQLNQYNLPYDANSKLMAWGTNMGSIGQTSFPTYGDASSSSGYPKRSYSLLFNLGSKGSVDSIVTDSQYSLEATVSASTGSVTTSGPAGVSDSTSLSYGSSSFDPVYSAYTFTANANVLSATFTLSTKTLKNPVLRVKSYTGSASPVVKLDGVTLVEDVDYFASKVVFDGSNELWLTLNKTLTGTKVVSVN
jgi:hypothetical protein